MKIKFIYTQKYLRNVLTYYMNEFYQYCFNAVVPIDIMVYFLNYSFITTIVVYIYMFCKLQHLKAFLYLGDI